MEPKKLWLVILLVAVTITVFIVFGVSMYQVMHSRPVEPANSSSSASKTDELVGISFKIPGSEKGSYWELSVSKLEKNNDTGSLSQIHGQYIQNKQSLYRIVAKTGSINWQSRRLEVSGAVVFETHDGKILTAENVVWDPVHNRIHAQDRVHLKTATLILDTDSLDASLGLEKAALSGLTKVIYRR